MSSTVEQVQLSFCLPYLILYALWMLADQCLYNVYLSKYLN